MEALNHNLDEIQDISGINFITNISLVSITDNTSSKIRTDIDSTWREVTGHNLFTIEGCPRFWKSRFVYEPIMTAW